MQHSADAAARTRSTGLPLRVRVVSLGRPSNSDGILSAQLVLTQRQGLQVGETAKLRWNPPAQVVTV